MSENSLCEELKLKAQLVIGVYRPVFRTAAHYLEEILFERRSPRSSSTPQRGRDACPALRKRRSLRIAPSDLSGSVMSLLPTSVQTPLVRTGPRAARPVRLTTIVPLKVRTEFPQPLGLRPFVARVAVCLLGL